MSALTTVGDKWDRFWFTPQPASTLTLFRVWLGATVLAWSLSWIVDLYALHGETGIWPEPTFADYRISILRWFETDTTLWIFYVLLLVSAAAVMIGSTVRLAAPVMWLLVVAFELDNTLVLNAGDELLRIWCTYFAVFALLTPGRLLSEPLFGREVAGERTWRPAPTWLLRLAQIQLTIIYPATVIAKMPGDTWREGTASMFALGLVDFERLPLPAFIRESLVLGNLMTWAAFALEIALPFLLWTKRTRRVGIVLGLGLHLSFAYTMRLGFFFWVMALGYVSFLRADESARLLSAVSRMLPRRSRATV